jgi:hypothetical protein
MIEKKREIGLPTWVWSIVIGIVAIGVAALIIFLGT